MVIKKAPATTKKAVGKVSAAKKAVKTAHTGGTTSRTSSPVATDAPAATRVDDRAPDSEPIPAVKAPGVIDDALIKSVMRGNKGKWGTGRDRDTRLANAGYDVEEVRRAVRKARTS